MIDEGLIITGVGMLVVFTFLIIMEISVRFMSGLILKFFPEKEEPVTVPRTAAAADESELAVAIAVAHTL